MEPEPIVLFIGIGFFSILLVLTVFCLIWYSGLLCNITVGAGPPPCGNLKVAYKFGRGPYKDVGAVFTEVTSLAPKLKCFGVYYDDPKQVPADKLRWAVGTVLAENSVEPDPSLLEVFTKEGFKSFCFPAVNNVVKTSFPYRTQLSVIVGIYRVYPELASFIKRMKLCAHPFIEVYTSDTIHYFAPLSKQEGFYVPEAITESGVHFSPPDEQVSLPHAEEEEEEEENLDPTGQTAETVAGGQVEVVKDSSKDSLDGGTGIDATQTDSAPAAVETREDSSQKVPEGINRDSRSKDRSLSHQNKSRTVPQLAGTKPPDVDQKAVDLSQETPDLMDSTDASKGANTRSESAELKLGVGSHQKDGSDETANSECDKSSSPAKLQYPGVTSTTGHSNSVVPQLSDSFSDEDPPQQNFISGSDFTSDCASASNYSFSEASYSCSVDQTSGFSGNDTSCALSDISGASCPSPGVALADLSSDSDGDHQGDAPSTLVVEKGRNC